MSADKKYPRILRDSAPTITQYFKFIKKENMRKQIGRNHTTINLAQGSAPRKYSVPESKPKSSIAIKMEDEDRDRKIRSMGEKDSSLKKIFESGRPNVSVKSEPKTTTLELDNDDIDDDDYYFAMGMSNDQYGKEDETNRNNEATVFDEEEDFDDEKEEQEFGGTETGCDKEVTKETTVNSKPIPPKKIENADTNGDKEHNKVSRSHVPDVSETTQKRKREDEQDDDHGTAQNEGGFDTGVSGYIQRLNMVCTLVEMKEKIASIQNKTDIDLELSDSISSLCILLLNPIGTHGRCCDPNAARPEIKKLKIAQNGNQ